MPKSIIRRQVPTSISLSDSLHPVLQRVYSARNITNADELDYSLEGLLPFHSLLGIEQAMTLLADAIVNQKRVLIISDYDVDGATSCALAIRGLRQMGAANVQYLVPNRFEYGYGLSPEIVEVASQQQPDLLITVDNGITSIEGVALARSLGIDVLITDHHLPGDELPNANAIVNPNQRGDIFPSKYLAGVGVMFYVLAGLRAHLQNKEWFARNNLEIPNLACLLDLVALGTIADLVPLDRNNRILVAYGLSRIRAGQCVPGIRELVRIANRSLINLGASDLGFVVGPRLNAAGRLKDMTVGIECLIRDDVSQLRELAIKLDRLNKERREIQKTMQVSADMEMLELKNDNQSLGLCFYNESWHQGVIGILASKIKDKWQRPVIAFAQDNDSLLLKGSARSVQNVHIRDVLESINTRKPGLLLKFGGHAMAAGLTIQKQDFERFRTAFTETLQDCITESDLENVVVSDGELQEGDLNLSLAKAIVKGGPWGSGFSEPVFDGLFEVLDRQIVGQHHLKMELKLPGTVNSYEAIAFNTVDDDWPENLECIQLAYRLGINEFRGKKRLQLVAEHIEPIM